MKNTALVLTFGLALAVFGCSSDDGDGGTGGIGGAGGTGGGGGGGAPGCTAPGCFIAADCQIFGAGVPVPLNPSAIPSGPAVAGVPVDVELGATVVLPAALVCGFVDVTPGGTVSNSQITFNISGGTPATQVINSFIDDGSQSPTPVSPHNPTLFRFDEACGNAEGTCDSGTCATDETTSCTTDEDCAETGPGLVVPVKSRTSDPAVSGTTTVTPSEAGTPLSFTYEYATMFLPITTEPPLPVMLCIGGACELGLPDSVQCPLADRTGSADGICGPVAPGSPDNCGPNDSPRILYDARCDFGGFGEGTCSPFEDFGEASNICATGQPGTALSPEEETGICGNCMPAGCGVPEMDDGLGPCTCDNDDCCAFVQENYPTATPAQFPSIPVTGGGGAGGAGAGGAGG